MDNVLTAAQLQLRRGGRPVIDDVSLTLAPGEMVALIGPNGAGKSTLLRLLTGYLAPDAGACALAGRRLEHWSARALSRCRAVMLQQTQLPFDWSVEAVVAMGRAPWALADEQGIVRQVMALTGSSALFGRRYNTLSGGEQQRVQLARALAQLWQDGGPQGWLFLDEPTSALDLYHQQQLLRLLKHLTRGSALHVCVVVHDLNLAALWADRLILLHAGKIVAAGTAQAVIQREVIRKWYGAQVHVTQHPEQGAPQVLLAL